MKYSVRITDPETGAHSYLWNRDKGAFTYATARRHWRNYLANNPGALARIEDQFRDPAQTLRSAAVLEGKARRLYALRLMDPLAPQYETAARLMDQARAIRQSLTH
jgi:hypothetical protein